MAPSPANRLALLSLTDDNLQGRPPRGCRTDALVGRRYRRGRPTAHSPPHRDFAPGTTIVKITLTKPDDETDP